MPRARVGATTPFTRFWRNPAVRVSVAMLRARGRWRRSLGPVFMPAAYQYPTPLQLAPPSVAHWLGTDVNGRDQLYRVFVGARISLVVGLTGALVAFFVGTSYGLISGYAGGRVDGVMMRLVEVVYSIPRLIFIIILINVVNAPFNAWLQTKLGRLVAAVPARAAGVFQDGDPDPLARAGGMADDGADRARAGAGVEEPPVRHGGAQPRAEPRRKSSCATCCPT